MYVTPPFYEQVQAMRRREAERQAAHWRFVRTLQTPDVSKHLLSRLWRQFGLLSHIRERKAVRARLRQYAAR